CFCFGLATLSGLAEPLASKFPIRRGALARKVHSSKLYLGNGHACLCGFCVPLDGFGRIAFNASAFCIINCHVVGCGYMALLGCAQKPSRRFSHVSRKSSSCR